jgi:hypothetical protein
MTMLIGSFQDRLADVEMERIAERLKSWIVLMAAVLPDHPPVLN